MNAEIEIRTTHDGAILARRSDGRPLTAQDKEEAKRIVRTEQAPVTDPTVLIDGSVVAVLIDSSVLGAPIWFAFRNDWKPEQVDAIPIFYASELPALRQKTAEQLRSIFNVKGAFGSGRFRQ